MIMVGGSQVVGMVKWWGGQGGQVVRVVNVVSVVTQSGYSNALWIVPGTQLLEVLVPCTNWFPLLGSTHCWVVPKYPLGSTRYPIGRSTITGHLVEELGPVELVAVTNLPKLVLLLHNTAPDQVPPLPQVLSPVFGMRNLVFDRYVASKNNTGLEN